MIASGSSDRGLSEVTTAISDSSAPGPPHQRALLGVSVAAAAEHRDQPMTGQPARRCEHVLERVRRVGVVDDHAEGLALVDRLEAAGNLLGRGQRPRGLSEVKSQGVRDGQGRKGVGDVEVARQRCLHVDLALGRHAEEPGAGGVEGDAAGAEVGRAACGRVGDAVAAVTCRELLCEPLAVRVIEVHNRDAALELDQRGSTLPHEQDPLGSEVVLHARMEVEMVLAQVGEDLDGEIDRVGPVQDERVRGDLHRAGVVARLEHAGEGSLQVDRLGRRPLDVLDLTADHLPHRPEQAATSSGGLQQVPHEERRGRLAVGPGDSDDGELGGRVAVEGRREWRHRCPCIADQHLGRFELQGPFDDQGRGPGIDGRRGEVMAVVRSPGKQKNSVPSLTRRLS